MALIEHFRSNIEIGIGQTLNLLPAVVNQNRKAAGQLLVVELRQIVVVEKVL